MKTATQKLPTGVSYDEGGQRYLIQYKNADGVWRREHAGKNKAAGIRLLAQRKREASEGLIQAQGASGTTKINTYAERWYRRQKRRGERNADREYSSYKRHLAPLIGGYRVSDLKPMGIVRLAEQLVAQTKDGGLTRHTAKSVHNLIGILSSIYGLVVLEGAVEVNPVSQLPKGSLPAKSKQKRPPYTAAEATTLMTCDAIPRDRRMLHALQRYTGRSHR